MTTLTEIREQRTLSEAAFQEALNALETLMLDNGPALSCAIASVYGFHREVCALHAAELSLISNGTIH
jgi:hypothetical protein